MTRRVHAVALAVGGSWSGDTRPRAGSGPGQSPAILYTLFERYLDALRQQTGIPGLSAVIVRNGQVDWERGFGVQDIEQNLPATSDTPYPVGGLTQAMAAVLLGACAEEGRLGIDDPMASWVDDFAAPEATIRHVLAHASAGAPAFRFQYDPSRYAALTTVGQRCADSPFRLNLAQSVFDRLGMISSVPGEDLARPDHPDRQLFDDLHLARYDAVVARQAAPYRVDRAGRATRTERPSPGFSAADGVVTTARDLVRFEAALDEAVLLRPQSLRVAWSPVVVGDTCCRPGSAGSSSRGRASG